MARSPKNGKSGATEVVATTLILPTKKTIEDLAQEKRNSKKRMQAISGTLGQTIGKAVEEKHVDRKALSIACQLDALDEERLHVTYFHLLKYMDDLGIPTRAKAQEELFEEHKPDDHKEDAGEGKMTRIGAAARKVAEDAGAKLSS